MWLSDEVLFIHEFSVPCLKRAASIEEEYEGTGGEILVDNEDNDGWLATHGKPKGNFLGCEGLVVDVWF